MRHHRIYFMTALLPLLCIGAAAAPQTPEAQRLQQDQQWHDLLAAKDKEIATLRRDITGLAASEQVCRAQLANAATPTKPVEETKGGANGK